MSKVLLLGNSDIVIYNFRLELVEELLKRNHQVIVSCPYGERVGDLIKLGAKHSDIKIDRHGTNPFKDLKLIRQYKRLMKEEKPDMVFSYTIKPNIYGAIAARKCGVPFVANITGLGTAVEYDGFKQRICVMLYKYAFKKVCKVFFQNTENRAFFEKHKIALGKHDLLPGSGVNLERFSILPYPDDSVVKFVFIGRIMQEKGIDLFLESARFIKTRFEDTEFHVFGFVEEEYKGKLQECADSGLIRYHGMVKNIQAVHEQMHCTVSPSYYPEGISNVLLEAAACARPIITTDRAGCRETVDDGISGFLIKEKDQNALNQAMLHFMEMSYDEREKMGLNGRKKVEREFDRKIIVNRYLEELE